MHLVRTLHIANKRLVWKIYSYKFLSSFKFVLSPAGFLPTSDSKAVLSATKRPPVVSHDSYARSVCLSAQDNTNFVSIRSDLLQDLKKRHFLHPRIS